MRTLLICLCLALVSPWAQAERLKDIASIAGIRSNQLIGYGLVVGLDGSGDQTTQTPFTVQTFNNMLTEFGIGGDSRREQAVKGHGPGSSGRAPSVPRAGPRRAGMQTYPGAADPGSGPGIIVPRTTASSQQEAIPRWRKYERF